MKRLIVIMVLFFFLFVVWGIAFGFTPDDIVDGDVLGIRQCGNNVCVLVNKDGKEYMAVGVPVDGGLKIITVYVLEEGKPKLIFGKGLVEI